MERTDVVVVGAGLSGLRTAGLLQDAGVESVVFEAQDRVGGRTLTEPERHGSFVDHGGQWMSPDQPELAALADELGVTTFDSYEDGAMVDWADGARQTYDTLFPPDAVGAEQATLDAAAMLTARAESVSLDAPWATSDAGSLDRSTLVGWLEAHCPSPRARAFVARAIEGVFASGPGDTSLLAALYTLHSHHSLAGLDGSPDPGPERRFDGGTQQLSEGLARPIRDRLRLGQWVHEIEQDRDGVVVRCGPEEHTARRVVVTLPPPLAGRIRYLPAMPASRDSLTQRAAMGWLIKVHAIYDEPFWRTDGLSGGITSDEGPIRVTADNSPPGGSPGVLVGFIEGADARRWATDPDGRRAAALACFARYFGPAAARPADYCDYVWGDDPYSRGAYAGYWSPGLWTAYGSALREPVGRIHWAGTETSPRWNGKMEGALLSARRVGDEVLAELQQG